MLITTFIYYLHHSQLYFHRAIYFILPINGISFLLCLSISYNKKVCSPNFPDFFEGAVKKWCFWQFHERFWTFQRRQWRMYHISCWVSIRLWLSIKNLDMISDMETSLLFLRRQQHQNNFLKLFLCFRSLTSYNCIFVKKISLISQWFI